MYVRLTNDGRDRLHAMPSVGNGRCEILKHFDVLFFGYVSSRK
jgi:hypothetical protein